MPYSSVNPFTEELFFQRPSESLTDITHKINVLQQKQSYFAKKTVPERTALLLKLAQKIEQNKDILAQTICHEVGRCLTECQAEIEKSIQLIHYYVHLAPELLSYKTIATQASLSQVRFEPLGLVLAIMPWNYPIWQILRFAIPALCAANGCLIKPAPSVGKVTELLFELVEEEIPFDVVYAEDNDIEAIISQTNALAFTGSTQTGQYLASLAGKHLKKCVLELGGSNAFIVLEDADLKQTAKDACYARFRDAGQSCNAAKRLILLDSIADEFIHLLITEAKKLNSGDPLSTQTTLAPLHSAKLQQKAHHQVSDALEHGATLLLGGSIPEGKGFFYPATIIDNVNQKCKLYHEEAFAPIMSILHAHTTQEAIHLANDSPYGLGASIYSKNNNQAWQLAEQLNVGSVFINRHTSSDLRLPFGGVKNSGFGRELSEFGLYEFVNIKSYWQK
ncbi:aldehyde dehydrogenase family protein [Neisseria sp. Ec49-e6-T10]|uniref:aldehyde dehydrogenase family protein n=1 Tax=Neisseria sp. Ec49-e6-T10 TaxID=3140744 RepID=UPI003EB87AAA